MTNTWGFHSVYQEQSNSPKLLLQRDRTLSFNLVMGNIYPLEAPKPVHRDLAA